MFDEKQKFLFRCEDCHMIVSVELDDEEDLKKVYDNEFVLECLCQGKCIILRD